MRYNPAVSVKTLRSKPRSVSIAVTDACSTACSLVEHVPGDLAGGACANARTPISKRRTP